MTRTPEQEQAALRALAEGTRKSMAGDMALAAKRRPFRISALTRLKSQLEIDISSDQ
jgi:hypothetical protein